MPAVLAGADVALDERALGEQHPGLLVLDETPPQLARPDLFAS